MCNETVLQLSCHSLFPVSGIQEVVTKKDAPYANSAFSQSSHGNADSSKYCSSIAITCSIASFPGPPIVSRLFTHVSIAIVFQAV